MGHFLYWEDSEWLTLLFLMSGRVFAEIALWPPGPHTAADLIRPLLKLCCHSQPLAVPHSCCIISMRFGGKWSHPMADCWALAPPIGSTASQVMTAMPPFPRLRPWGPFPAPSAATVLLQVGSRRHSTGQPMARFFVCDCTCLLLFFSPPTS